MLRYGSVDHGPFVEGIGDFTEKIRSGVVMPGRELPADSAVPESLIAASRPAALESGDDAAVLDRQDARQKRARAVLAALRPLQRWERFGEPRLCGAMSYGLLVAPDIDIGIFGDLRVDAGYSLVSEWARDPAVDRTLFINAVGAPDGGLGWELRNRRDGVRWTVQMWLLSPEYDGPSSHARTSAGR